VKLLCYISTSIITERKYFRLKALIFNHYKAHHPEEVHHTEEIQKFNASSIMKYVSVEKYLLCYRNPLLKLSSIRVGILEEAKKP
jgi:hypothetical protein